MPDPRGGLILLDKPGGITSFEALGAIKRSLETRKVGHTGTLDRFAEGLLPVLAGRMTRLNPVFVDLDKSYEAEILFGAQTDTLDPEGGVVAEAPVPDWDRVRSALDGFTGEIEQVPPEYSAVHTGGQRAHRLARAGGEVRLAARRVTVWSIEPLGWDPPVLKAAVRCSKGTYVRSLARDLGLACGSRASLRSLRRTAVGGFRVEEAVRPESFLPERDVLPPWDFLERIPGVIRVSLPAGEAARAARGAPVDPGALPAAAEPARWAALFGPGRGLVALLAREGDRWRGQAVLGGES